MALGAMDRQAHRRRSDDTQGVVERLEVVSRRILDGYKIWPARVGRATQVAGRDQRIDHFRAQFLLRLASSPVIDQLVSSDLLLEELVVRLVGIEGANDPIA